MPEFRTVPLYRWPNGHRMERILFSMENSVWRTRAGAGTVPFQLVDRRGDFLAWAALKHAEGSGEIVQSVTDKNWEMHSASRSEQPSIAPDLTPYFVTFLFDYLGLSLDTGITAAARTADLHVPWPTPDIPPPERWAAWKDRANTEIGWNADVNFQALHYVMKVFPDWLGSGIDDLSIHKIDKNRIVIDSPHLNVFVEWEVSRHDLVRWRVSISRKGLERAAWFPELYGAMFAAPFTVEVGQEKAWVAKHGIKGEPLFELDAFRMLGLELPVLWLSKRLSAYLDAEQGS